MVTKINVVKGADDSGEGAEQNANNDSRNTESGTQTDPAPEQPATPITGAQVPRVATPSHGAQPPSTAGPTTPTSGAEFLGTYSDEMLDLDSLPGLKAKACSPIDCSAPAPAPATAQCFQCSGAGGTIIYTVNQPPPPPPVKAPPQPARRRTGSHEGTSPRPAIPFQKSWDAGASHGILQCPICKEVVKGGRSSLRQHQMSSSRCAEKRGDIPNGREPCPRCQKPIAANDDWAMEQHSRFCPGQGSRSVTPHKKRTRPTTPRRSYHSEGGDAAADDQTWQPETPAPPAPPAPTAEELEWAAEQERLWQQLFDTISKSELACRYEGVLRESSPNISQESVIKCWWRMLEPELKLYEEAKAAAEALVELNSKQPIKAAATTPSGAAPSNAATGPASGAAPSNAATTDSGAASTSNSSQQWWPKSGWSGNWGGYSSQGPGKDTWGRPD